MFHFALSDLLYLELRLALNFGLLWIDEKDIMHEADRA